MKHKIGDKVNPVINPAMEMVIDTVQLGCADRYHCWWFVDGKVEETWFNGNELIKAPDNDKMGFNR